MYVHFCKLNSEIVKSKIKKFKLKFTITFIKEVGTHISILLQVKSSNYF